jgi:hypothetical protein
MHDLTRLHGSASMTYITPPRRCHHRSAHESNIVQAKSTGYQKEAMLAACTHHQSLIHISTIVSLQRSSVSVCLYFRLYLSYRDVEEPMAERGIILTYAAVPYWCRTFGSAMPIKCAAGIPDLGTSGTLMRCF